MADLLEAFMFMRSCLGAQQQQTIIKEFPACECEIAMAMKWWDVGRL
jgi:hypothetical protein